MSKGEKEEEVKQQWHRSTGNQSSLDSWNSLLLFFFFSFSFNSAHCFKIKTCFSSSLTQFNFIWYTNMSVMSLQLFLWRPLLLIADVQKAIFLVNFMNAQKPLEDTFVLATSLIARSSVRTVTKSASCHKNWKRGRKLLWLPRMSSLGYTYKLCFVASI